MSAHQIDRLAAMLRKRSTELKRMTAMTEIERTVNTLLARELGVMSRLLRPTNGYRAQDLTGKHFGRLLVLRRAYVDGHGAHYWQCQCDCGRLLQIRRDALTKQKSCGCIAPKKKKIAPLRSHDKFA